MVGSEENLCPIGVVIWLGFVPTGAHQRHGLRQAVAALYASDGGGTDRSGVDAARDVTLPRATVATAASAVVGLASMLIMRVSGPGVPTDRVNGLHQALGTQCERSGPSG